MKKLFTLLMMLIAINSFAQSGWVIQNSNTSNSLWGLNFSNSLTGYSDRKSTRLNSSHT